MKKKNRIIFFSTIIFLIALGQLIKQIIVKNIDSSKIIIDDFFKLSFIKNTGGAFGLGNNYIWIFILLNIVIITVILIFTQRKKELSKIEFIGYILLLSGGTGNLIDRIFRGYVVDYIDINDFINYPVFNLEDMLIVVGIVIIMIYIIKLERRGSVLTDPMKNNE
ncbi:MAG: signal peptidase II [Clostridia bacterium]|nr:signal peptidase II [Clostridia bacterium]